MKGDDVALSAEGTVIRRGDNATFCAMTRRARGREVTKAPRGQPYCNTIAVG